jgi:hypothetical protein
MAQIMPEPAVDTAEDLDLRPLSCTPRVADLERADLGAAGSGSPSERGRHGTLEG